MDADLGSAGMPQNVVNSFFKDEEDLTPQVSSHLQALLPRRRLEFKADVTRGKNITGASSHAMVEIAKVVPFRVNGPNDIAHRVHQLTRDAGDIGQRLREVWMRRIYMLVGDLAQDGDLREAGADVVMQVCGDPRADALEFQQPRYPVMMEPVNRRDRNSR